MKDRELLAKSITTKDAVSDGRESPSLLSDKLSRLPWSTLYASVFVLAYCYCHFLVRLSNPLSRPKHQRIKTNSKPSNRISLKKKKVFSNKKKQRSSLLDQLKQQENTISQTSRSLRETQATLAELSKDIASLTTSIEKLQNQQSQQQSILSKQLAAAFKQGKHSSLQLILSGEESQRSERILAYFSYLNEARQKPLKS